MALVAEKPGPKPIQLALTATPQEQACLKRALEGFPEPPRKKIRLTDDTAAWEAEYKYLLHWLDENLPAYSKYSKPGGPAVKCTDEQLRELQKLVSGAEAA